MPKKSPFDTKRPNGNTITERLAQFVPQRMRLWLAFSCILHLLLALYLFYGRYKTHDHSLSSAVMITLGSSPASGTHNATASSVGTPSPTIRSSQHAAVPPSASAPTVLSTPKRLTEATASITNVSPSTHTGTTSTASHKATIGDPTRHSGKSESVSKGSTGLAGGGSQVVEGVFGQGDGPSVRHRVMPEYPAQARRRQREGVVQLRLTISETGVLQHCELLKDPGFGFAEAAIQAIKQSRFTAGRRDGKPVSMRVILPIRFQLEDS